MKYNIESESDISDIFYDLYHKSTDFNDYQSVICSRVSLLTIRDVLALDRGSIWISLN